MSENNKYFYNYDNENCPKKEDRYYHMQEKQCCPMKENKYYPKKEEQYYPNQENKHCSDKKQDQCCCKLSIRRALELLSSDQIRRFLNFNAAAFISRFFLAGSNVDNTITGHTNLAVNPLAGTLFKLNRCECDRIQISGSIFFPELDGEALFSGGVAITARETPLCAMKAIAIEVAGDDADGTEQTANYNAIRAALRRFKCPEEDCNAKCDECCCGNGTMSELAHGNLSGQASLTVGPLALEDVDVLACIGNALILGSPFVPAEGTVPAINPMIFVVCSEDVDYII